MEITRVQSNVIPLPSTENSPRAKSSDAVTAPLNSATSTELQVSEEPQPTETIDVESVAAEINSYLQDNQRTLQFRASEGVRPPVIEVYDRSTDQLIREIPSQEAQRIAEALRNQLGLDNGSLLKLEV